MILLDPANAVEPIDIDPHYLEKVKEILHQYLPGKEVVAYGSRVKGTATSRSDLDLVAFATSGRAISEVNEALEESIVPFPVNIYSWETLPEDFRANIAKKYSVVVKSSP